MFNKKGQEQIYMYVFYLVIAIIILFSMIYFVTDLADGKAVKKQLTAKKIALLLDTAKPGTRITLNSEDVSLEQKENKIYVKTKGEEQSYEYKIYSSNLIMINQEEDRIIIEVKNE